MTNPLPTGPFELLYADPPWQTVLWSGETRTPTQKAGEDHYPTLSLDELAALPVKDIAADHAVLAMWIIGSHLDQALALGEAWGFRFVTDLFCWVKQKLINAEQIGLFTDDIAEPPIGMGKYSRKQIELCLLFKRGRGLPVQDHGVSQLIVAPKREHSRKPPEAVQRLETLFGAPTGHPGDVTRLELFSRTQRAGWTSWGNQTGKFEEAAA